MWQVRPLCILFIFVCLLISCSHSGHTEYDAEDLEDLEIKIEDIEEDFFIAFEALQKIDTLLRVGDVESAQIVVSSALSDLGEIRFYKYGYGYIDMLTLEEVNLSTRMDSMLRLLRYQDYKEKRETFSRIMDESRINIDNNIQPQ